jgi:hypothetical protein
MRASLDVPAQEQSVSLESETSAPLNEAVIRRSLPDAVIVPRLQCLYEWSARSSANHACLSWCATATRSTPGPSSKPPTMLALCARYQFRRVGLALNPSQSRTACDDGSPANPPSSADRFASVPQQSLVYRPPPHAAGRRRVERIEHTAAGLSAHERQRRPSERQVSRCAARRPVEHPRHQCQTRRRIVAHGRDLRPSQGERARVVPHRE